MTSDEINRMAGAERVRTIADDQQTFREIGHLIQPLIEEMFKQAIKSGEPFEITTPGYRKIGAKA